MVQNSAEESVSAMPPPSQRPKQAVPPPLAPAAMNVMGTAEAKVAAEKAALAANTLEELEQAIKAFEGLSVKATAMNCVYSDGNKDAPIMLIGEAPGADEDIQGKPFVGASGQLLDKLLSYINVSRKNADPASAVYISNILNWRPPGNRTPTPQEMDISLPFIERHIALVKPKILLLVGNTPTKALLQSKEGIMKLRGSWHDYVPTHPDNQKLLGGPVLALPTFHPAFLLRNPNHKKTVWFDTILLQKKREELKITP
jgi:DNA polymerase